jgi:hypothetical protein
MQKKLLAETSPMNILIKPGGKKNKPACGLPAKGMADRQATLTAEK